MTGDRRRMRADDATGLTLVEVMIALVILSIGIMALGRVLPIGSRAEMSARLQSTAVEYGNEVFERTRGMTRNAPVLAIGRHPATDYDTLGTLRSLRRYYVVSQLAAPLDSLLKIDASVLWRDTKPESVTFTSYIHP